MIEESMKKSDRFKLLYDSLVDHFKWFIANGMTTLTSLIIAIGWILTSEQSRLFLHTNHLVRYFMLAIIAILSIIHSVTCIGMYVLSKKKVNLLSQLDYVHREYYDDYKITGIQLVVTLMMNLSLFILLGVMVNSLKSDVMVISK